jgi:hypothetical protein
MGYLGELLLIFTTPAHIQTPSSSPFHLQVRGLLASGSQVPTFFHHTWIYFMKYCSEALSIYKNFSTMIHTHFVTSIRVFRVDSAGEYLFDALC